MNEKGKSTLVEGLGIIATVFFLLGIFTNMAFITGLVIALVLWLITGILVKYWDIDKFWGIRAKRKK